MCLFSSLPCVLTPSSLSPHALSFPSSPILLLYSVFSPFPSPHPLSLPPCPLLLPSLLCPLFLPSPPSSPHPLVSPPPHLTSSYSVSRSEWQRRTRSTLTSFRRLSRRRRPSWQRMETAGRGRDLEQRMSPRGVLTLENRSKKCLPRRAASWLRRLRWWLAPSTDGPTVEQRIQTREQHQSLNPIRTCHQEPLHQWPMVTSSDPLQQARSICQLGKNRQR